MPFGRVIVFAGLIAAGICAATTSSQAQNARGSTTVTAEMAADRTVVWEQHNETTILSAAAVQAMSQARLSVTGNQTLEILEAYTRKADGRIVPVEPAEIATQEGAVGELTTFVDLKIRQVPFRDVAVGDTLVLKARYTEREHYIPGQFSYFGGLAAVGVEEAVSFTLRMPANASLRHSEYQYRYEETREGETLVRRWSGTSMLAPTTEVSVTDMPLSRPHFAFSTFDGYEAIGRAYAEAAASKMQTTPKLKALAEEITSGKGGQASQADAIFQWVAKNVRYVGVYFGAGRIVPNDVDVVIARRFGDCKDKAALTAALLAAVGIPAEQVLIQIGPAYILPETPIQQAFNHVIVYLPTLDRFIDPSTPTSTFASLPQVLAGKPVVRASAKAGGAAAALARTPVGTPDENVARIDMHLTIAPDEMMKSESAVEATGEFAQTLRQFASAAEARGPQVAAEELMRSRGLPGPANVEAPPALDHREPYRMKLTWAGDRPTQLLDRNWQPPGPLGVIPAVPVMLVSSVEPRKRIYHSVCRPGHIVQNSAIELPDGIVPQTAQQPVSIDVPPFHLQRSWVFDGKILAIRTEILAAFESRNCAPELIDRIAQAIYNARERLDPPLRFVRTTPKPLD